MIDCVCVFVHVFVRTARVPEPEVRGDYWEEGQGHPQGEELPAVLVQPEGDAVGMPQG